MPNVPVSLQLYSIRDLTKADFAGAAAQVAAIGYVAVELAGFGNLDAKGAKAALDASGLKVSGMHVGIKALREQFDKIVEDAGAVGARDIICPSWPSDEYSSPQAVETMTTSPQPASAPDSFPSWPPPATLGIGFRK